MFIISLINGLLPSFVAVPLYRLRGYKIGKGVKIRFSSFLFSKKVEIKNDVRIGPFVIVKSKELFIGNHSSIKPLCFISTAKISMGQYVQISGPTVIANDDLPTASFSIGDHSRILPFCWLEPGAGITIGKQVGIGGHTKIFTHGHWQSYLKRGPINFGPVVLEDEVCIGWDSFIMPNLVLGKAAFVGANSTVTKSVDAYTVAVGSPAKPVRQVESNPLSASELYGRLEEIIDTFLPYAEHHGFKTEKVGARTIICDGIKITCDANYPAGAADLFLYIEDSASNTVAIKTGRLKNRMNTIDLDNLEAYIFNQSKVTELFIGYLRKYGIRLYINYGNTL